MNSSRFATRCHVIFVMCLLLTAWRESYGNIWFFPGDAFFHSSTDFDGEDIENEDDKGEMTRKYRRPAIAKAGMGAQIGLVRCVIKDPPLSLKTNLRRAQIRVRRDTLRSATPKDDVAKRELHEFIYNDGFDMQSFRIGLKYNESWMDGVENRIFLGGQGLHRYKAQYSPFTSDRELLLEDWFNSKEVEPLTGELPAGAQWRFAGPPNQTPYQIDGRKIKFVLVEEKQLQGVMLLKLGAWCYVARETGVTLGRVSGDGWEWSDMEPE